MREVVRDVGAAVLVLVGLGLLLWVCAVVPGCKAGTSWIGGGVETVNLKRHEVEGPKQETVREEKKSQGVETHDAPVSIKLVITPEGAYSFTATSNTAATRPASTQEVKETTTSVEHREVVEDKHSVAAAQPSGSSDNAIPSLGGVSGEGVSLGGTSFKQILVRYANAWPLCLLVLACAVGAWFLGARLLCGLLVCVGILIGLVPGVVAWIATIGAVVLLAWLGRSQIKQVMTGAKAAIDHVETASGTGSQVAETASEKLTAEIDGGLYDLWQKLTGKK